jgi:hypothetical protein
MSRLTVPARCAAATFLAALCALGLAQSAAAADPPTYYPNGPQANVSKATVSGGGWRVCWDESYTQTTTTVAAILAQCPGDFLMLAGAASVNATSYTVLAAAPRADVTTPLANTSTAHRVANGSGWYFSTTYSWGFFKAGDTVSRGSCDTASGANPTLRLCWHTTSGRMNFGYRAGTNFLNGNGVFRRMILVPGAEVSADTTAPVVTPAVTGT